MGLAHSVRDRRRQRGDRALAPSRPARDGEGGIALSTLSELARHHKAAFATVLGYTAGGSLIFYTFTTYMQKYLVNSAGMSIKPPAT